MVKKQRPPTTLRKRSPSVLIVEDHDDTREMLRLVFEMEHFAVFEAIDGQAGIDLAIAKHPDVILMDLTLPIVDGICATRTIRKDWSGAHIPIIFLSGRAEPVRKDEAMAAGCTDYLVKPISLEEMFNVVRRWLPGRIKSNGSRRNHEASQAF